MAYLLSATCSPSTAASVLVASRQSSYGRLQQQSQTRPVSAGPLQLTSSVKVLSTAIGVPKLGGIYLASPTLLDSEVRPRGVADSPRGAAFVVSPDSDLMRNRRRRGMTWRLLTRSSRPPPEFARGARDPEPALASVGRLVRERGAGARAQPRAARSARRGRGRIMYVPL